METTIKNIYWEQALEIGHKERNEQEIIEKFKSRGIRIEKALQIFDFLPIRQNVVENGYVKHLWDAFLTLDSLSDEGRAFLLMPFHLLFMLALQYKVLRTARKFSEASGVFFSGVGGRNKEQLLNLKRSVFDIALINERTIPELFGLTKLNKPDIKKIKDLIDKRNDNLAHAKGGIDPDPNGGIEQYIDALRTLQLCFLPHNNQIADDWLSEISDEDDLSEYVDARLPDSQLCPADFRSGMLSIFSFDEDMPFEEWQATVSKVLASGARPGLLWLQHVAQNHSDGAKRLKTIQMLNDAGKLDELFKIAMLQIEKDSKIIELLSTTR